MTLPATVNVGIAFGYTPADATPVYTDVTAYVMASRGVNISTGRSSELDTYQPGTASFVLNNSGRRFDPTYASSPYVNQIRPRLPVKITATYSAVTYDLFRGFIDGGWPQEYDESNRVSFVPIRCKDSFMIQTGFPIPVSAWEQTVTDGASKTFWYTWDNENKNQKTLTQSSYQPTTTSASYAAPIITGGSWAKSLDCQGGTSIAYGTDTRTWSWGPAAAARTPTTLEMWVQRDGVNADGAEETFYYSPAVSPDVGYVVFSIGGDGGITFRYTSSAVSSEFIVRCFSVTVADGKPHHISMVLPAAGGGFAAEFYVDGIRATDLDVDFTQNYPIAGAVTIGSPPPGSPNGGLYGRLDDVVCSSRAMTQAEILARYQIGISGREGEGAVDRIDWLLNSVWPRGHYTSGGALGGVAVGPYKPTTDSLLAYAKLLEVTEDGEYYQFHDGQMWFGARGAKWSETRSTTLQATFSDDGSDSIYLASDFTYDYSELDVINKATVSSSYIAEPGYAESPSIDEYGVRPYSVDTIHISRANAQAQAEWKIYGRENPSLRIKSIRVSPLRAPTTLFATVLARLIGDRVKVERTPQKLGSQIATTCHVEGIKHQITGSSWVTTFELSQLNVQDNFMTWVTTSGATGTNGWGGTKTWGY
jgi:hypothetical protein